MPGFACDWSANARPRTEARACATHGRERAQLATRIAACRLPRRLSLHGQETGGGARSRLGRGGARHGRTRSQSPLFSAPCTQRRGHRVWCVCVCAKYRLAVPLSWLACRLVTPWPPRHSAVETRGCGASHMGARRAPYPARVGENWQANPQLTTTGPVRPVDRRRDLLGGR